MILIRRAAVKSWSGQFLAVSYQLKQKRAKVGSFFVLKMSLGKSVFSFFRITLLKVVLLRNNKNFWAKNAHEMCLYAE